MQHQETSKRRCHEGANNIIVQLYLYVDLSYALINHQGAQYAAVEQTNETAMVRKTTCEKSPPHYFGPDSHFTADVL